MKVLSLAMATILAGSSTALLHSVPWKETGGKWVMKDFTRKCNDPDPYFPSACDYSLNVYEPDYKTLVTACNLHIEKEPGSSALQFSAAPGCTEGFWANGDWNPQNLGFQTISIVKWNEPRMLVGFFGVADFKVNGGTSGDPVVSDIHYATDSSQQAQRRSVAIENAKMWKVMGMNRFDTTDGDVYSLHVAFNLTSTENTADSIFMFETVIPENEDPLQLEFQDIECVDSQTPDCKGWTLSWGNMRTQDEIVDGAIMTLVSPGRTRAAWFGWNRTRNVRNLPDNGPNAVKDNF